TYTVFVGFKGSVPSLDILEQSIRNLYFHVPMWFAMMSLMFTSMVYSIFYLSKSKIDFDIKASAFAKVGFLFGFLGILTGTCYLGCLVGFCRSEIKWCCRCIIDICCLFYLTWFF
ncbi:MAG TPA: hypothetical protein PLC92_07820, partial [Chitinophagales bacterium]|nr:hypothetical protein [Chitinophagales bacterium]